VARDWVMYEWFPLPKVECEGPRACSTANTAARWNLQREELDNNGGYRVACIICMVYYVGNVQH